MKKYLLLLCFIAFGSYSLQAQTHNNYEATTLIFVRHAEKANDDPRDPSLNTKGQERAQALKELLVKDYELSAIYSTPYKRTRLTAQPAAKQFGLDIQEYGFDNPASLAKTWVEQHKGEVVLILGHSNTTPYFVNMMLGEERFEQLDEDEYGKIFIVKLTKVGNGTVQVVEY